MLTRIKETPNLHLDGPPIASIYKDANYKPHSKEVLCPSSYLVMTAG